MGSYLYFQFKLSHFLAAYSNLLFLYLRLRLNFLAFSTLGTAVYNKTSYPAHTEPPFLPHTHRPNLLEG